MIIKEALTVNGRTVNNRIVFQPMEGCDGTAEGHIGELTERRYVVLCARHSNAETESFIKSNSDTALFVEADISSESERNKIIAETIIECGGGMHISVL